MPKSAILREVALNFVVQNADKVEGDQHPESLTGVIGSHHP